MGVSYSGIFAKAHADLARKESLAFPNVTSPAFLSTVISGTRHVKYSTEYTPNLLCKRRAKGRAEES